MSWKVLSDQAFVCIIIVSIGSKKPLSLVFLASRPLCYRPILMSHSLVSLFVGHLSLTGLSFLDTVVLAGRC